MNLDNLRKQIAEAVENPQPEVDPYPGPSVRSQRNSPGGMTIEQANNLSREALTAITPEQRLTWRDRQVEGGRTTQRNKRLGITPFTLTEEEKKMPLLYKAPLSTSIQGTFNAIYQQCVLKAPRFGLVQVVVRPVAPKELSKLWPAEFVNSGVTWVTKEGWIMPKLPIDTSREGLSWFRHELGHAFEQKLIPGGDGSSAWANVWRTEQHLMPSDYAQKAPKEGFAECFFVLTCAGPLPSRFREPVPPKSKQFILQAFAGQN